MIRHLLFSETNLNIDVGVFVRYLTRRVELVMKGKVSEEAHGTGPQGLGTPLVWDRMTRREGSTQLPDRPTACLPQGDMNIIIVFTVLTSGTLVRDRFGVRVSVDVSVDVSVIISDNASIRVK